MAFFMLGGGIEMSEICPYSNSKQTWIINNESFFKENYPDSTAVVHQCYDCATEFTYSYGKRGHWEITYNPNNSKILEKEESK